MVQKREGQKLYKAPEAQLVIYMKRLAWEEKAEVFHKKKKT